MSVFLSKVFNNNEIASKISEIVSEDATYIAKVPKKLQNDMNLGLLDFMINKETGEKLGVLVNTKHKMRGHMHIEKTIRPDFADNLSNIATQQQLAQVNKIVDEVRMRVIVLQEGQDLEIFGSIRGMRSQLL